MAEFRDHSVAEFFRKNAQMLGLFGKGRVLTLAVHEFVTNSLDACDAEGILPEIKVSLRKLGEDRYLLVVSDNGPGIPPAQLGRAFGKILAGTKFHVFRQSRGQQGIGGSGIVLFAYTRSGKPVEVWSSWKGRRYRARIYPNPATNQPKVEIVEEEAGGRGVEVRLEISPARYDGSPLEYLRLTALLNPHASISFTDPLGRTHLFRRHLETPRSLPPEVKPHPKGVTPYDLVKMAEESSFPLVRFLSESFSRMSREKALEALEKANLDPQRPANSLSWEQAKDLVKTFQGMKWTSPSTSAVKGLGIQPPGLRELLEGETSVWASRKPQVFGGIPFLVEGGLVYPGKGKLLRAANFVPLLYDAKACVMWQLFHSFPWEKYGLEMPSGLLHIASVRVPYAAPGKQSVASIPEIRRELLLLLRDLARKLSRSVRHREIVAEEKRRQRILRAYFQRISQDLSKLSGKPAAEILKYLERLL